MVVVAAAVPPSTKYGPSVFVVVATPMPTVGSPTTARIASSFASVVGSMGSRGGVATRSGLKEQPSGPSYALEGKAAAALE